MGDGRVVIVAQHDDAGGVSLWRRAFSTLFLLFGWFSSLPVMLFLHMMVSSLCD